MFIDRKELRRTACRKFYIKWSQVTLIEIIFDAYVSNMLYKNRKKMMQLNACFYMHHRISFWPVLFITMENRIFGTTESQAL